MVFQWRQFIEHEVSFGRILAEGEGHEILEVGARVRDSPLGSLEASGFF